jgi:hypothetical protein
VVEGEAVQVTDESVLERLAEIWAAKWDGRWRYEVHDRGFRHEGGSGAVLVFSVKPAKGVAFAKGTFGQTRHRFSVPARRTCRVAAQGRSAARLERDYSRKPDRRRCSVPTAHLPKRVLSEVRRSCSSRDGHMRRPRCGLCARSVRCFSHRRIHRCGSRPARRFPAPLRRRRLASWSSASWICPSFRGRPIQNRGDVLEQLQPSVEGAAFDHVEGHVWVSVVDPVLAGASGYDG